MVQVPVLGLRLLARAGIVVVAVAAAATLAKKYHLKEKVGDAFVKIGESIKEAKTSSSSTTSTKSDSRKSATRKKTTRRTHRARPQEA